MRSSSAQLGPHRTGVYFNSVREADLSGCLKKTSKWRGGVRWCGRCVVFGDVRREVEEEERKRGEGRTQH